MNDLEIKRLQIDSLNELQYAAQTTAGKILIISFIIIAIILIILSFVWSIKKLNDNEDGAINTLVCIVIGGFIEFGIAFTLIIGVISAITLGGDYSINGTTTITDVRFINDDGDDEGDTEVYQHVYFEYGDRRYYFVRNPSLIFHKGDKINITTGDNGAEIGSSIDSAENDETGLIRGDVSFEKIE